MPVCLYVDAPATVKEIIAGLPAGTDAAVNAAHQAFRDAPVNVSHDSDPAFAAFEAALATADPLGVYSLIGDYDQGLHRFQADRAYLDAHGLDPHAGATNDPELVRTLLIAQRAWAHRGIFFETNADAMEAHNRLFLEIIDRLVAALDAGTVFGLYWA